jgi:hypothetical protein
VLLELLEILHLWARVSCALLDITLLQESPCVPFALLELFPRQILRTVQIAQLDPIKKLLDRASAKRAHLDLMHYQDIPAASLVHQEPIRHRIRAIVPIVQSDSFSQTLEPLLVLRALVDSIKTQLGLHYV